MRLICPAWRLMAILLGTLLSGASPLLADFGFPRSLHTQTVRNDTGKVANDLHVNLVHGATGEDPKAPPFTEATTSGRSIDFSGANVVPGQAVPVTWESWVLSDRIDPADPGHWTMNGMNIGNVSVVPRSRVVAIDLLGGLVRLVVINESATAINYQNLQVWSGADASFFNPSDYLTGQSTGSPVALLVPTAGVFLAGTTDVATFSPTLAPTTYNSGSALLDGEIFGMGASSVPEPGPLELGMLLGLGSFLTTRLRKPGPPHSLL